MNLIKGKVVVLAKDREAAIARLEEDIYDTLKGDPLKTQTVLNACHTFSKAVGQEHVDLLISTGLSPEKSQAYIKELKVQLHRDNLINRLKIELGHEFLGDTTPSPGHGSTQIDKKIMPLGTLLHITPGNQLGLGLYSAIEGLLTGNINLIKLPSGDQGSLSVKVLRELIKIEPILKDYIYLFDYSSKDTQAIKRLMALADGVVVWGGDKSIEAIRSMAGPKTKLIEWGHKISFAYISQGGLEEKKLYGLAQNIAQTNQLLCSSCQGIYLETDAMADVYQFCKRFLPMLEKAFANYGQETPMAIQAKTGLMVYTETLKRSSCRVFHGQAASLLAYEDYQLETAIPYGNCWVKRLPRQKLISNLRPRKNHLQTAGLLCAESEEEALTELLWKAGLVRVTQGQNMSKVAKGEAHDGEYALRRYTRIVSKDFGA